MKSLNDYFGNRTRDLTDFSAIPQPTAPPRIVVTFYRYMATAQTLTLGRLMSYIYMEHPFLMFLDHTQRRSTVGRTPLDE